DNGPGPAILGSPERRSSLEGNVSLVSTRGEELRRNFAGRESGSVPTSVVPARTQAYTGPSQTVINAARRGGLVVNAPPSFQPDTLATPQPVPGGSGGTPLIGSWSGAYGAVKSPLSPIPVTDYAQKMVTQTLTGSSGLMGTVTPGNLPQRT